jgi:hypothetical protein
MLCLLYGSWKFRSRNRNEFAHPIAVIPSLARYEKIGFCSLIGRRFRDLAYKGPSTGSWLNEKLVVTYQGHYPLVAVNSVLSEHLASRNGSAASHLFNDKVNSADT